MKRTALHKHERNHMSDAEWMRALVEDKKFYDDMGGLSKEEARDRHQVMAFAGTYEEVKT